MAGSVKKLKFLSFLAVTPCTVELFGDAVNQDGEQETELVGTFDCIFDEKSRRVITADGKEILSSSSVLIEGDIAPGADISSGRVKVKGGVFREIANAARLRNPDGTVNHTRLELK